MNNSNQNHKTLEISNKIINHSNHNNIKANNKTYHQTNWNSTFECQIEEELVKDVDIKCKMEKIILKKRYLTLKRKDNCKTEIQTKNDQISDKWLGETVLDKAIPTMGIIITLKRFLTMKITRILKIEFFDQDFPQDLSCPARIPLLLQSIQSYLNHSRRYPQC